MGTIRNGANGGFSGKAGSVIGSRWNDISYIKGLPKISTKPASLKQLDQKARFAAVLKFMGPIKDMLLLGYRGQKSGRTTGFNLGIQHALGNAVTGIYPDYGLDKSKLQISKGTVQPPSSLVVSSAVAGSLDVAWSPQINDLNAFPEDAMVVLLYNEQQNFFLSYTKVGARSDMGSALEIPADFSGQTVHAYFFYVSRNGDRQSPTTYVAPIVIV